jgi:hypothetical protein
VCLCVFEHLCIFAREKWSHSNCVNWTSQMSLNLVKMLSKFKTNLVWHTRAMNVFCLNPMKKSASSLAFQVIICESKVRACGRWPPVLRWLLLADEFTKCVIFYILSHQKYIIIKECFYLCLMYFGLGKMHLNHFIRKWITAIFNQISLVMLAVFRFPSFPSYHPLKYSLDVAEILLPINK